MRRVVANAMLCLLVMLSVAAARCEVRCGASAMPMQHANPGSDNASTDSAAMDPGMQDCDGMKGSEAGLSASHAACGAGLCTQQTLPAFPDANSDLDVSASMQQVVLVAIAGPGVADGHSHRGLADRPPLPPQCSPLDQGSSLRV